MKSRLFGYAGLNLLLAFFFLLACVTSVVLTNRNYNTSANTNWILVGALAPSSANFRVRLSSTATEEDRLVVSMQPVVASNAAAVYVWDEPLLFSTATATATTDEDVNSNTTTTTTTTQQEQPLYVQSITVDSLQSDTLYYYGILSADGQQVRSTGQFRTAPPAGQRTNFQFATAGCAMTGSRHAVFSEIAKEDILFFLHLGDFHYLDIDSDILQDRITGIDKVLGSSSQTNLLASTALAYMWDDHDWLGNDSYGYSPGRETALASYRQAFPHPEPLPSSNRTTNSGGGGVYHAFTIGTVRFVLSDLRSERTQDSIYSEEQREWLYNELTQADQYDFVIWVTPTPWIGPEDPDEDSWMGAPVDRRELSSFITAVLADTQNLLAISADAHMVGFDDGSHTFYGEMDDINTMNATTLPPSFPILHSGPLDRLGSIKGGPYSDGCTTYKYERNHQYSVIAFDGDGDEPCLDIRSYRVFEEIQKEEIFSKRLCGQIFRSASEDNSTEGTCEAKLFSTTNLALIATASSMLAIVFVQSCFLGKGVSGAFLVSSFVVVWFGLSLVVGLYIPIAKDYAQFDTFPIAMIGFLQIWSIVVYLMCWVCSNKRAA